VNWQCHNRSLGCSAARRLLCPRLGGTALSLERQVGESARSLRSVALQRLQRTSALGTYARDEATVDQ